MDYEERIVLKDQTFTDIAVRELADIQARLLVYQYYHVEQRFKRFAIYDKYKVCYEQMNDYDRLRVDRLAADLFAKYMSDPYGFMPYKVLKRRASALFLIFFFIFFLGFIPLFGDFILLYVEKPEQVRYSRETIDLMVHENITELRYKLYDIDGNGEITCLDRGCEFKHLWDRKHPDIYCKPVQNINPRTGMNHMVMEIYGVFYEPASFDSRDHTAKSYWGSAFDPAYNHPVGGQQWFDYMEKHRRW